MDHPRRPERVGERLESMRKAIPSGSAGPDWFRKACFYQIYPRSFCDSNGDGIGDLPGIESKLDYLADLGVEALWLCPIYASPNDDNGYDISDYRAIHPDFGTMRDFDRLLEAMHSRGLKLIMDMVLNHSSDEHEWFRASRASRGNEKRDWYVWAPPRQGADSRPEPPNRWGSIFGGSAWAWDEATGEYYLHLFSPKQPDLNWEKAELRAALYGEMRFWLEKGVDGFRLDVINLISKASGFPDEAPPPGSAYSSPMPFAAGGPRLEEFLKEMRAEVFEPYGAIAIGETPAVTVEAARRYTAPSSRELDMLFQFELMDIDGGPGGKWDFVNAAPEVLERVMRRWQAGLGEVGWNSLYWSNHDQSRAISRFGDEAFREESGKALAGFLYLQKGSPFIYQGEEIGMLNYPFQDVSELRDIESLNFLASARAGNGVWKGRSEADIWRALRAKGRDNARTPMQWDPGPFAGFSSRASWISVHPRSAQINVGESIGREGSLLEFYRSLIAFRGAESLVAEGDIEFIESGVPALCGYRRFSSSGRELWVVTNLGSEELADPPSLPWPSPGTLALASYEGAPVAGRWRPWELRVWLR